MSALFSRLAAFAIARRRAVVAATVFVTLIGAVAALRLDTDAGTSTLVDEDSETALATERLREQFGDEAVAILARGDLEQLVLTEDLGQLLRLEGCLSGNLPAGGEAAAAPCEEIARLDPVRVVYGPATFLNQSAIQAERFLNRQAAAAVQEAREAYANAVRTVRRRGFPEQEQAAAGVAAAQEVLGRFQGELLELAVATGQSGLPRLDDPRFVESVVFDSRLPQGTPKARFSVFFPSPNAAQILVRLRPELDPAERSRAIELIREAVAEPTFRLDGGTYLVSGVPVVVEELADEFRGEIFVLLAAALAVMTLVLTLAFRPPLSLLPLALALVATAVAFGLLSLSGQPLTMASVAVFPVLIGLAVDYAIQFQARQREAVEAGEAPARAARSAAARGGPVIATAALATGAGFLVLLLSPVPMVRGFGSLLVVGIAVGLAAVLTTGVAALAASSGPAPSRRWPLLARLSRLRSRLASSFPGRVLGEAPAAAVRDGGRAARALRAGTARTLAVAITAPGRVLAVSILLAAGGWALGTRTEVVSDLRELVPGSVLAEAGADELQEETGVSGELNVVVTADDVTDPEVIGWMGDLKQRILGLGGFTGQYPSCEEARICPQISLTDLFPEGMRPSARDVRTLLRAIPPYFSQAMVAGEPPATANLAFGIRLMPLDEQKELIDAIRAEIDPPAGVEADVAGLPALAADANAELSDSRYWLTLAGLAAVALVLLTAYRSLVRALVPLVPVVLATGWSQLVIFATGIPLNPMSATLGALVIAIATEFSVILAARYREERSRGRSVGEALRLTYARTGSAVLVSGITAIAGFAVLLLSGIRMLRDFGLVTVLDLTVALLGVMLVLPAALVWAERRALPAGVPRRPDRRGAGIIAARLARRGARGG